MDGRCHLVVLAGRDQCMSHPGGRKLTIFDLFLGFFGRIFRRSEEMKDGGRLDLDLTYC